VIEEKIKCEKSCETIPLRKTFTSMKTNVQIFRTFYFKMYCTSNEEIIAESESKPGPESYSVSGDGAGAQDPLGDEISLHLKRPCY
jgi:hypothetical protein